MTTPPSDSPAPPQAQATGSIGDQRSAQATRSSRPFSTPPGLDDLDDLARTVFASLPEAFRAPCRDLVIRVEEFPDEEVQADMGLDSPFELLGLYHGVSLDRKSLGDLPGGPDMVFLYRSPLLDYWIETGEDLTRLVRHVLIHEIGHHFGFSDAAMATLEEQVIADEAAESDADPAEPTGV